MEISSVRASAQRRVIDHVGQDLIPVNRPGLATLIESSDVVLGKDPISLRPATVEAELTA